VKLNRVSVQCRTERTFSLLKALMGSRSGLLKKVAAGSHSEKAATAANP
jgi:hypothetical protein